MRDKICLALLLAAAAVLQGADSHQSRRSWAADNGNGTYSNPLFYDEFSDPDMIRVGSDYYLTGTTMHAMPGLPILHSRDLVNWTFIGYAFDRLDLSPDFRLEDGKQIYGSGHLGSKFPLPRRNLLHLRKREPLRPSGVSRLPSAGSLEAQSYRTGLA
jgi:hypothetical protein